jgi:hypothetical protein
MPVPPKAVIPTTDADEMAAFSLLVSTSTYDSKCAFA